MNEFNCACCHGTFFTNRTDEEVLQEYEQAPWNVPGEATKLICSDCFEQFRQWFDALTPDDHIVIRKRML